MYVEFWFVFVRFEIYDMVKKVFNRVRERFLKELVIWIIVVKLEEVNVNIGMVEKIIERGIRVL